LEGIAPPKGGAAARLMILLSLQGSRWVSRLRRAFLSD